MSQETRRHWAKQHERGSFWLMRFTAAATRLLGRRALTPLLYLVVLYFYASGRRARLSIRDYQSRLAAYSGRHELQPSHRSVLRQFLCFADSLLDKLDVWNGRLALTELELLDPDNLRGQLRSGAPGRLLVGSHLGNLEVCRALAELGEQVRMNVPVHTKHAENFNRLLNEAGAQHLRLIQVSELDPAIMMQLAERLERGEWLAIAGDRVPLHGGRSVEVEFLGAPASFPQGPWLLAGLLQCPVGLMHCLKINGHYQVRLEHFADAQSLKRSQRQQMIEHSAQQYAQRLTQHCLDAPYQWFNFYPFWKPKHDDDLPA